VRSCQRLREAFGVERDHCALTERRWHDHRHHAVARLLVVLGQRPQLRGIGDAYFDLTWIDGFDALGNVLGAGFDALQLGDAIGGLGDIDFGLVDADIGDGLSAVTDGAGDFLSSASDLLDFGDGCGCDGCDLGF